MFGIRIRITATTSFYFSVLKDTFIIRNSKYLNCVPNVPVTVENKNLKHYFCILVVLTAVQILLNSFNENKLIRSTINLLVGLIFAF